MLTVMGVLIVAGVLCGSIVGAVVTWALVRDRRRVDDLPQPSVEPELPEGVTDVIGVLGSAAVVIGTHDQVIASSTAARNLGVVRGTRLDIPVLMELVRQSRQSGEVRTAELELRRGPRTPLTVLSARVAPVGAFMLVLAEDRTQARRVEETRRDFVANVSHELKTPVGALSLLSEAVEDAADDPEAVRRFASRMRVESERLTDLVGSIIELSRLQADEPMGEATVVDVDAVLAIAADRRRVDAERRRIALVVGGEKGLTVMGDADQLAMAVSNLVENAVIYSDEDGRVVLSARRDGDEDEPRVEISVSDSGIGIERGEVQRIFERFYRVDFARSRDNGGTGLGLAMVKHIAGAHGGEVSVWSRPGQGSTFTLRLPAAPNDLVDCGDMTQETE